jgi:formate dehydrogenase maturation protein FdhE
MKPENMSNDELIQALENKANEQVLWNTTAQLYAEAAERLRNLTSENSL